jgi:GGDEF domain-containing protein
MIWHPVAFVVLAASSALVLGVAVWRLLRLLQAARASIDDFEETVGRLEHAVRTEAQARSEVEDKLAARVRLTAMRRATESDALNDPATGLFSEGYFTVALDARIATARRNLKPVAVVLLEVIEGLESDGPRPADAMTVAESINTTMREADTACRLMDGGYSLVLEDTTENGAIWTVERIRRHLTARCPGLTLWAGVACYPAHGLTTEEVLDRADLALDIAREWRQDRIEVASIEG